MPTFVTQKEVDKDVPHPTFPPAMPYLVRSTNMRSCTLIKLLVHTVHTTQPFAANALLDSGAMHSFINARFINIRNLQTTSITHL